MFSCAGAQTVTQNPSIYPTTQVVVKAVKKNSKKGGGDGWGVCVVLIKAIRKAHLTPSPQETSLEQRPEGAREPGRQVPRGRGFRQKGRECKGPGAAMNVATTAGKARAAGAARSRRGLGPLRGGTVTSGPGKLFGFCSKRDGEPLEQSSRALFTVSQLLMGEIAIGAVFGCGSVRFGLDLSKRLWLLLWVMKGPGVGVISSEEAVMLQHEI